MDIDTLAGRLGRVLALVPEIEMDTVDALAGLTPGHTGQIRRGRKRNPSAVTMAAISRVLGTTVEWLTEGRGAEPSAPAVRRAITAARLQPAPRRAQRAS